MVEAVQTDDTGRKHRRRQRWWNRRRLILAGVAAVFLLFIGAATAVAVQGLQVRSTLTDALPLVERIDEGLRSGNTGDAQAAVAELQEATAEARAAATGPHWSLVSVLPWVGANVEAVSTTAVAIDDVARNVLEPLVGAAETLDYSSLAPVDGRIRYEPLAEVEPTVTEARQALDDVRASMDAIDTDQVVGQIAGPVEEVQQYIDELDSTVGTAARAARLLPPMLGAEEPRTYLVLFQNTAEIRSTGGVASAFAVVEADDGQLSFVHQGTAGDLGLYFDEPVLELDPAKEAIYTERLGRFFSGVNLTPDFPTAAELAAEMARLEGFEVDGVVATDTVALSHVLDATGSVTVADAAELTADDAVSTLLSDVYWQIPDQRAQDAFFAAAAAAIFETLTSTVDDPVALVDALATAAGEHRLLVWSSRQDEQEDLQGTVLSGAFDDTAPSPSTLGVFLNDGTSAKMQYYLETEVEHVDRVCGAVERLDTISVTLRSTAPPEAVDEFPPDVTGVGNSGVPTGSFRTNVAFYGPESGEIRSVARDGTYVSTPDHSDGNRPVRVHTAELAPGESVTFEVEMVQPKRGEPVEVWSTPTIREGGHRATADACP